MLLISDQQFWTLGSRDRDAMFARLRASYAASPHRPAALEDDALWSRWCDDVAGQGRNYGATTLRALAFHATMRFWFGRGYVDDPCSAWLRDLLLDDGQDVPVYEALGDLLPAIMEAAVETHEQCCGQRGERLAQHAVMLGRWCRAAGERPRTWDRGQALALAETLLPQRFESLTADGRRPLLDGAERQAQAVGLGRHSIMAHFVAMFAFGIDWARDPLFATLNGAGKPPTLAALLSRISAQARSWFRGPT